MSIAKHHKGYLHRSTVAGLVIATGLFLALAGNVHAGTREQAKRIHDRIAGVPPDNTTLADMKACLDGDSANCSESANLAGAVAIAMRNKNFYNATLKNMITPWTNEDRSVFDVEDIGAFNDYTALVIGIVRDDYDFREILYANKLYIAGPGAPASVTAGYSSSDNLMYRQLENSHADLGDSNVLSETTQSGTYSGDSSIPANATAGVMTTRQGARAFFYAGTNRAMFRFTMLNHLCNDLEGIKDITRPNDRIRQDVTRSPGGDSRIYLNGCIGCHAGMDGMMGAFAYYDWIYTDEDGKNGHLIYNDVGETNPVFINSDEVTTDSRVTQKALINYNNFINGYITRNDSWVNYWRKGPNNERLGFGALPSASHPDGNAYTKDGYAYGFGAKQLGQELANSRAFAECQVKKVYRAVCHGDPDITSLTTMTDNFTGSGNYRLKTVFTDAVSRCLGP